MLYLYVVICAGSFSCHVVDMPSLCEYYNLYDDVQQCSSMICKQLSSGENKLRGTPFLEKHQVPNKELRITHQYSNRIKVMCLLPRVL